MEDESAFQAPPQVSFHHIREENAVYKTLLMGHLYSSPEKKFPTLYEPPHLFCQTVAM